MRYYTLAAGAPIRVAAAVEESRNLSDDHLDSGAGEYYPETELIFDPEPMFIPRLFSFHDLVLKMIRDRYIDRCRWQRRRRE